MRAERSRAISCTESSDQKYSAAPEQQPGAAAQLALVRRDSAHNCCTGQRRHGHRHNKLQRSELLTTRLNSSIYKQIDPLRLKSFNIKLCFSIAVCSNIPSATFGLAVADTKLPSISLEPPAQRRSQPRFCCTIDWQRRASKSTLVTGCLPAYSRHGR